MTNDQHKNIFIIDDSVDMRSLLKLILESRGYEANCSANGEEALNILSSLKRLPDLILLDLRMPVMDGFDFLECQRLDPRIKNIPVVVMTGEEDPAFRRISIESAVLTKPLSMSQVLETVGKFSQLHY